MSAPLMQLKTLLASIKWIVASELDANDKYAMVFSEDYSGEVVNLLRKLGVGYHFVSPEESDKIEEMEQFVVYLSNKIAELEREKED